MDTPSVSQQRATELLVRWSQADDVALAQLTPPTGDYCEMPFETIFHRSYGYGGARKSTSNAKSRRIHGTLRLLLVISQAA
jgi:hypothetical protein